MPWSIEKREGYWFLISETGETEAYFDERVDAVKMQRSLHAAERAAGLVAAITYEEPKPEPDTRLEEALARLDALAEKEERQQEMKLVISSDQQVQEALIASINQISERLENGERVTESLVASLQSLATQAPPVVNVSVPEQAVPVVNVAAPVMPEIVIPEIKVPDIHVPAAEVTVMLPESRPRNVTFTRDPIDGKLQGAEITEE